MSRSTQPQLLPCPACGNAHDRRECFGVGKIRCDLCPKPLRDHKINEHEGQLKLMQRWVE